MAIGESGRVVLEIDPVFKRELYASLTLDGLTLKDWFIAEAERYMRKQSQPELFDRSQIPTNKPDDDKSK